MKNLAPRKLRILAAFLGVPAIMFFCLAVPAGAKPLPSGNSSDAAAGSAARITAAYSSGAINLETFVVQSLKAYFAPEQVDQRFAASFPNRPTRDITPLLDLARTHYAEFSPESQAFLDILLKRPDDPTYTYPWDGTNFYLPEPVSIYTRGNTKIHYVTHSNPDSGGHVHQTTDAFALKVADSFDAVLAKSVTADGFPMPPDDPGGAGYGGDTKFDVYLMNTGPEGVYGYLTREGLAAGGDGNSYYSFMVIDNDFVEFVLPTETAEEAMQVTVAHEFHHAIQNAVNGLANSWYKECTATWNERNVYPAIKDNLQYLNGPGGFFAKPWYPLDNPRDAGYSTWLWDEFLTLTFGAGTVKDVWTILNPPGSNDAVTALDTFLSGKSETLLNVFRAFTAKNYSQAGFYADAAYYDTMAFTINDEKNSGNPYTVGHGTSGSATITDLDHLAAEYAQIVPGNDLTEPDTLAVQVAGPYGKAVSAIVIVRKQTGGYDEYPVEMTDSNGAKTGGVAIPGFWPADTKEVAIVLVNGSQSDDNQTLSFTAELAIGSGLRGDINGDGLVNITDVILCLRQAIGLDPADPALADLNDDGFVNITDVILVLRKAIGLDP